MAAGAFQVGHRFVRDGQLYRIARFFDDGVLAVEDISTGRVREHPLGELLQAWKSGALTLGDRPAPGPEQALQSVIRRAHLDAFEQTYPVEQQARAKARLAYVTRLERLPRTHAVMRPIIEEIWADSALWKGMTPFKAPPHPTSVADWIRTYQASDRDIRSLVDRRDRQGNTSSRYAPPVDAMVEDLLTTRYLTLERPTLTALHRDLKGMVATLNTTRLPSEQLKTPTLGHLQRKVRDMAPYDVCKARYGQRAADIRFRVAGQGVPAVAPLARAAMDHSRLDVFVIDERSGLPLGRPWLTVVIDECTRYVLGYYLGFEEPSAVSMSRALKHAMAPKEASEDVVSLWDAWGLVTVLVVDNGMEFHGQVLAQAAERFGTTVQFCPRRKPWYKGKVERFFGTLNTGLLDDKKGKTFSSVALKGDYDPAQHAVMTLATLRRVVHTWIVDVYHQETHRGLAGRTPAEEWNDRISGVQRLLPPSALVLESAFSRSDRRRLTHKGIEFDCLFYNCDELGALRIMHGAELEVEVRVLDEDLGSLIVVAPDNKTLIQVPAVDAEYAAGLTRWQHRVCKRFQQRTADDQDRHISLLDARNRIRRLIEEDMQVGSRKSRKQQQRFLEENMPSVSTAPPSPPQVASEPPVAPPLVRSSGVALPQLATVRGEKAPKPASVPEDAGALPAFESRKVAGGGR